MTLLSGQLSELDGTATPVPERFEIAPDLYGRELREDILIFTHEFPWPANSLLVVMENRDLVLVDTPYTPAATETLVEWLREHYGERRLVVINTGFHVDNLGGNSYLVEEGIPVYGSDKTVERLATNGEKTRAYMLEWLPGTQNKAFYDAHASIPFIPPTEVFQLEDGLELEFGADKVQVFYPGPSHTPDNVVVNFPAQRVLFGGCMILTGDKVGNAADADLKVWPDSVRQLKQFKFDILVPGHGDRFDVDLLDHTLEVLEAGQKK